MVGKTWCKTRRSLMENFGLLRILMDMSWETKYTRKVERDPFEVKIKVLS